LAGNSAASPNLYRHAKDFFICDNNPSADPVFELLLPDFKVRSLFSLSPFM
jgi:hypothetical protein